MDPKRRRFLAAGSAFAAASAALPAGRLLAQRGFSDYPFTLGVASGYPTAHGVVLWTRLAPRQAGESSALAAAVEVGWDVATDEGFRNIVRTGDSRAVSAWAHSVHVEVSGLEPGRHYFYRFHAGGTVSPTGRTRTSPQPGTTERLRFAVASCQHYEHGYFVAYRHMAAEDFDLVAHVGDYIYDTSVSANYVRKHDAEEPRTLDDFRQRYAQYKRDADLQAAHAAAPWIVTWDDHEVHRDYANDRSADLQPAGSFLQRRAAAYQAYYEHMPLPAYMRPKGAAMRIYTRVNYGALATFYLLDDRQYRSYHACARPGRGGGHVVDHAACKERLDASRSLLGHAQEQWLYEGLAASQARWNVITQQTLVAQLDRTPGPGHSSWTDGWDGYPRARERLLACLADQRVANPIVIGGDMHMFVVADLKTGFDDPASRTIATEFVCGSITSPGRAYPTLARWLRENPHIQYANGSRRGYMSFELTPDHCIARVRAVASVAALEAPIRDLAVYLVESGRPGAQRV